MSTHRKHRLLARLPVVLLLLGGFICPDKLPQGPAVDDPGRDDSGAAPEVTIQRPVDGDSYDVLTNVAFIGTASDQEDGEGCCGEDYQWSLVGGGVLGEGRDILTDELPLGINLVELAVTDSDGDVGKDTVEVHVGFLSVIAYDEGGMVKTFDGSQERTVTPGDHPDWSPDGSKIAFARGGGSTREIFVMDANGRTPLQLTNNTTYDHKPNWSPDGKQIAFVREDADGDREVYVMSSLGGNAQQVTNMAGEGDSPDWGQLGIVFQEEKIGDDELFVYKAGSPLRRMTENDADDNDADWSFDNQRIVFTSDRDGNDEIYIMNPEGDNQTRLTNNPTKDDEAQMSPDGTRVLFERERADGVSELYVMRIDGTGVTRVPLSPARTSRNHPRWKP